MIFVFWQLTSVPDYITVENIRSEYGDDIALIEAAINGNKSLDAELLELDDTIVEIYKQTYRRRRINSKNTYKEEGESIPMHNKYSSTRKGYTLREKTGMGKLEVNGEIIECVLIRLFEQIYLNTINKLFNNTPKTYH